jgi:hypothetical protein
MALIDEILALPSIGERIEKLKKGRGYRREPDTTENRNNWFIENHFIKDKDKNPDREIVIEKEKDVYDKKTGKSYKIEAKTEPQKANRIAIPIEQDIVNVQVGFGVGLEPIIKCDTDDEKEKNLLSALKYTMRKNRCKFNNKKEMRAWLAEQEVAEYWYAVQDTDNFWAKIIKKVASALGFMKPQTRLKSVVWSPFRGDKLYPFFENEDMTGFMREYTKRLTDNTDITCYMVITKDRVYQWEQSIGTDSVDGFKETSFKHGFPKLPVIYTYRPEAYCHNIKDMRERLEKTLSSYADCLDYHFFPYLVLNGDVQNVGGKLKNHTIELHGQGASATYLTWDQVPDTIKFEVDHYLEQMYSLTRTPRISFENLKDMSAVSGVAFKFYFMGAHMQESNNEEDFGEFLQRRVNFLVSALGKMNSSLYIPSQTIDVETEMVPYMIDNISDKVTTAVNAVNGGIWSRKHGMIFAGQVEHIDEELKEIEDDEKKKAENQMGQTQQSSTDKSDK